MSRISYTAYTVFRALTTVILVSSSSSSSSDDPYCWEDRLGMGRGAMSGLGGSSQSSGCTWGRQGVLGGRDSTWRGSDDAWGK